MFCTQITKMSDFRADMQRQKDTWLRNGTLGPIFEKFLSKDAQDLKEKSHKISVQDFFALKNYREKCRGGGLLKPPPPGLNRVNIPDSLITFNHLFSWIFLMVKYIKNEQIQFESNCLLLLLLSPLYLPSLSLSLSFSLPLPLPLLLLPLITSAYIRKW